MAKRFRSLLTRRSAIARLAAPMRIFVFLLTLALCWAPFAIPIYGIGNRIDPNAASIAAMSILYIEFLVLLWQWRRRLYDDSTPFKSCGLRRQRQDIQLGLIGLAIALLGLIVDDLLRGAGRLFQKRFRARRTACDRTGFRRCGHRFLFPAGALPACAVGPKARLETKRRAPPSGCPRPDLRILPAYARARLLADSRPSRPLSISKVTA